MKRPPLPLPPGFAQAEHQAVVAMVHRAFGDTLPGTSRISIGRHLDKDGDIICHVLVDGQKLGMIITTPTGSTAPNTVAFIMSAHCKY